jgi:rhamnosyltransferase
VGVSAVIVLYNPNLPSLRQNIFNLNSQVDHIFLVDNSISSNLSPLSNVINENTTYIFLGENLGIAKAQNVGIAKAAGNKSEFILLLDQDSNPTPNLVKNLISDYKNVINNGISLAVIGAYPINSFNDKPYKPRFNKYKAFEFNESILITSQVISSGSLIAIKNFYFVGEFKEELFIDGVDHEWCWRASTKGMKCAISTSSIIYHSLGEGDRKLLGIRVSISSIFRIYFQYRNFIYLCRFDYVPLYWKTVNLIKYLIKLFYYPIIVSPKYLPRILKGVYDGFKMKPKRI